MIQDEATGEVLIPMVNPDEIAKVIRVQNPALSWDNCNKEAALTANHLREMLADAGFDFAFETVGSHYSKVDF
jgi:predicted ABC-type ATPase